MRCGVTKSTYGNLWVPNCPYMLESTKKIHVNVLLKAWEVYTLVLTHRAIARSLCFTP